MTLEGSGNSFNIKMMGSTSDPVLDDGMILTVLSIVFLSPSFSFLFLFFFFSFC